MTRLDRDLPWLSQQLRKLNFLSTCSPEEFNELVISMEKVSVSCGQPVIRQGKTNELVFIIASGSFGVWAELPDGRKRRLESLLEGDYFGEVSVLSGAVANATVSADCTAELFVIPAEKIRNLLQNNAVMAQRISARAARRVGVQSLGYEPLPPEPHKAGFWKRAVSTLDHIVNA